MEQTISYNDVKQQLDTAIAQGCIPEILKYIKLKTFDQLEHLLLVCQYIQDIFEDREPGDYGDIRCLYEALGSAVAINAKSKGFVEVHVKRSTLRSWGLEPIEQNHIMPTYRLQTTTLSEHNRTVPSYLRGKQVEVLVLERRTYHDKHLTLIRESAKKIHND